MMARWLLSALAGLLVCAPLVRAQVNLPRGFEVLDIAVDDEYTGRPSINNCGEIVFSKANQFIPPYDGDIWLYDNGQLTQLTFGSESDDLARINDLGDIAWERYLHDGQRMQIIFLRDGVETIVDDAPLGVNAVAINNLGHLAWSRYRAGDCYTWEMGVHFWDGESVTQITPDSPYYEQGPALNDFDEIVWAHMDVCANPWTGRIQAWWDGQIVDLPSVSTQDQGPDINNMRHVSWSPPDTVVLWRDGELTRLAPDGTGGSRLSNRDDVFTIIWDETRDLWRPWLIRASVHRIRLYQLSDEDRRWGVGDLNDYGETVCQWGNRRDWGGGALFLRRVRTGDADFDDRIDLGDASRLKRCMTGPGRVDGLCECRFLDVDYDTDVDLADFSAFQNSFNPG